VDKTTRVGTGVLVGLLGVGAVVIGAVLALGVNILVGLGLLAVLDVGVIGWAWMQLKPQRRT
jgi:hypothetical protein